MEGKYRYTAACLLGLEGLAAQELRELGCEDVRAENGRVLFAGDEAVLARASLGCRTAERILIRLGEWEAASFEALFEGCRALPWEDFLGKHDAFPVTGSSLSSRLHSVPDCQAILKKAIVERLKERYALRWFPEDQARKRVRFQILKDRVSIGIDSSGEGLHKRGYRAVSNGAPLKETLAAALCQLSRLCGDGTLIDPFCGSGTILIEGALLATHTAPGLGRRFAAEDWPESDPAVWRAARDRARDEIRREGGFHAYGSDIDPAAVELTLANAEKAGVGGLVCAQVRDVRDFDGSGPYGCVICNPPYGERLGDTETARAIARLLGERFVPRRGWSYGIISPEDEFEKLFGRRADKRRKLYNGSIPCQYYQYFAPRGGERGERCE